MLEPRRRAHVHLCTTQRFGFRWRVAIVKPVRIESSHQQRPRLVRYAPQADEQAPRSFCQKRALEPHASLGALQVAEAGLASAQYHKFRREPESIIINDLTNREQSVRPACWRQ